MAQGTEERTSLTKLGPKSTLTTTSISFEMFCCNTEDAVENPHLHRMRRSRSRAHTHTPHTGYTHRGRSATRIPHGTGRPPKRWGRRRLPTDQALSHVSRDRDRLVREIGAIEFTKSDGGKTEQSLPKTDVDQESFRSTSGNVSYDDDMSELTAGSASKEAPPKEIKYDLGALIGADPVVQKELAFVFDLAGPSADDQEECEFSA